MKIGATFPPPAGCFSFSGKVNPLHRLARFQRVQLEGKLQGCRPSCINRTNVFPENRISYGYKECREIFCIGNYGVENWAEITTMAALG